MFLECVKGLLCGEELSSAACSISEGHNKTEGKKSNVLCTTLQNRVEKIFLHGCVVESIDF